MSTHPDADCPLAITRTSSVVTAYVSRNPLPTKDLISLIGQVHAAFLDMRSPSPVVEPPKRPTPAEIAASRGKDHLISFIDGKPYKMLKRHLKAHGLNPHTYRERYGLPADYPMAATSYVQKRALLAKRAMRVVEAE